jgi:hypothetical protein
MYSGYQKSNSTRVKETIGQGIFVASKRPEGPVTSHLDIGFLGFPLSSNKC